MKHHYLLIGITLLLSGCISKAVKYNEQWSKAKNLTNTAGMAQQMQDQQLPSTAYNKNGQLLDYKLGSISHPAYGKSSGVTGINVMPYGAFETFYWGWSVPGASHRHNHRLFAWMPENKAADIEQARQTMESMVAKTATTILKEMQYKVQLIKKPYIHLGIPFKQWYIQGNDMQCTFKDMNCVLSIYIPEPVGPVITPAFAFYATAGQNAWLFHIADEYRYPRVAITQGDGLKSIPENVFYQKLSARLPGWAYLYLAPDEVGVGENNKTISYPYVLEKGKPLLFLRPVR
ncbi:MAG: hypothetical protein PUP46_08075 [Endozoicomonas sp. (ex Botrylloides leachii)]|nr:hypothetical protein [Endozoicomonas sp. (ex Botrylloides leachii)]